MNQRIRLTRSLLAGWVLALGVFALAVGVAPDKGVIGTSPELTVSRAVEPAADYWSRGFKGIYEELLGNLKLPKPPFATRYVQPGPAWPDDVYLWDTAFIAEV